MGDMRETFKAFKEIRKAELKEEKNGRQKEAMELLTKHNIHFYVLGPFHLLVENRVDYWPSTGKFIDRKTKRKDLGIKELLRHIDIK